MASVFSTTKDKAILPWLGFVSTITLPLRSSRMAAGFLVNAKQQLSSAT